MKVLQINASYKIGSTGKIMADLNSVINAAGHSGYMLAGYGEFEKEIKDTTLSFNNSKSPTSTRINLLISRLTGTMGYRHKDRTKKAIDWIDRLDPDIIHLHNIHGDWINIFILFEYLHKKNIPVVWTLHDCWAFTGRCSHFENCGCMKWKTGCYDCRNKKVYPLTYIFDWSKSMYKDKKDIFGRLNQLTLVTPSIWLAKYVKESYLQNRKVHVIHNGIDTNVYIPSDKKSLIDSKVGNRKLILGVASSWSDFKGLSDFLHLNQLIDHNKYVIALIGLNHRQMETIPSDIIGIERTNNVSQLVDIYSKAYVFLNLSYQDNFPTTNIEALSCGTPVITYNTGGSPEAIIDHVGTVIEKGNIEEVLSAIDRSSEFLSETCRNTAVSYFDKNDRFNEYIRLYETLCR